MADFIWIYYLISVDSTIAALTGNFSIPYPCFTLQLTSLSHCYHFIANSLLYLTYSSLLLCFLFVTITWKPYVQIDNHWPAHPISFYLIYKCWKKNASNPKMKKSIHPREREEKLTSVSLLKNTINLISIS